MSKTIRNNDEFSQRNKEKAGDKQKTPTPYPPVEPTVAQKNSGQKDF